MTFACQGEVVGMKRTSNLHYLQTCRVVTCLSEHRLLGRSSLKCAHQPLLSSGTRDARDVRYGDGHGRAWVYGEVYTRGVYTGGYTCLVHACLVHAWPCRVITGVPGVITGCFRRYSGVSCVIPLFSY